MIEHCTMAEVVRHGRPLILLAGTTVQEACTALHERHAGAVLVMEEGKLKGTSPAGTPWPARRAAWTRSGR